MLEKNSKVSVPDVEQQIESRGQPFSIIFGRNCVSYRLRRICATKILVGTIMREFVMLTNFVAS